jgi:hypothetical protein
MKIIHIMKSYMPYYFRMGFVFLAIMPGIFIIIMQDHGIESAWIFTPLIYGISLFTGMIMFNYLETGNCFQFHPNEK